MIQDMGDRNLKTRYVVLALILFACVAGGLLITERALTLNVWLHRLSMWPLPVLDGKKVSLGDRWYPFLQNAETSERNPSNNGSTATFARIDTLDRPTPTTVSVVHRISEAPAKFIERTEEFPRLGRVMLLGRIDINGKAEYFAWIEMHNLFVAASSNEDLRDALGTLEVQ